MVSFQECQVLEERRFFKRSFSAMEFQEGSIRPSHFHRGGEMPRSLSGRAGEEPCPGFSHVRLKGEVV